MNRFFSFVALSAALAGGEVATATPAGAAPVKEYLGAAKEIVGDGPSPSRDIYETLARYKSDGSILFVVTLTGPIDPVNADAGIAVSIGSTCDKLLGLGIGLLSKTTVEFVPKAKKKIKARSGRGEVTNNVFTFLVKHPTLAGWAPSCYAVGLVDPTDDNAAPFDQTDEIPMKPRG